MSQPSELSSPALRRSVYALLIALSTGAMLGRILAVDTVDAGRLERHLEQEISKERVKKEHDLKAKGLSQEAVDAKLAPYDERLKRAELSRPFLSANDRSRWCTVRALVEPEMRVPGAPYAIDRVIQENGWDTIDMVKHGGKHGDHLYSSKPPLFPTLMAGEYWLIHRLTGETLGTHPYGIGRFILVSTNVVPLLIYFLALAGLVERFGRSDWGRLFVFAAAAFGTFLTTFAVTINNHLPAAVSAAVFLWAVARIWFDDDRRLHNFALAGLAGAFLAANELPALSLFALFSLALLWRAPRQTLLAYVPAALLVIVPFFATNYIAHDDLLPAYAHRRDGANWYDYSYERNGKTYESYWRHRVGIDRGEPSRATYALHVLVGHHGIFSLTPVWLLSVVGLLAWLVKPEERRLRWLAFGLGLVTLVCLTFYLMRPLDDRNYGGMTSAFRWVFWFAPLWLVAMLPAADWLASRRWGRGLGYVLLTLSALSAAYPTWNPWVHPWLLNWFQSMEWIQM